MKKENQTAIIGGIFGFTLGVTSMFFVETDKELDCLLKNIEVERVVIENIHTCEDIIEWMNSDIDNGEVDYDYYEGYLFNLEEMIEENRDILYK